MKKPTPKKKPDCEICEFLCIIVLCAIAVIGALLGLSKLEELVLDRKAETPILTGAITATFVPSFTCRPFFFDGMPYAECTPSHRRHHHEPSADILNRAERERIERNHAVDPEAR